MYPVPLWNGWRLKGPILPVCTDAPHLSSCQGGSHVFNWLSSVMEAPKLWEVNGLPRLWNLLPVDTM